MTRALILLWVFSGAFRVSQGFWVDTLFV